MGSIGAPVKFSTHAVGRYIERVRPTLCFGDAAGQLEALALHAEVSDRAPAWTRDPKQRDSWLVVGDDIAFPLIRRPGYLLATTCKVRVEEPARRAEARKRRAEKRRLRDLRKWRGNRKTHPQEVSE